ncbi:MAG: CRISPR-associated protein Cas4 [Oscillospiraceae bacterium]|nr:CRISPR-associated protein Cas4 [Oscillospiraceae bacterium]
MAGADDFLDISGLQHFCFCRRQWALIHLEQQWADNLRTAEGELEHKRCHDDTLTEKRGGLLTVRGMRVVSSRLRLSGICDVVEFRTDPEGVPLQGREGTWLPMPVEYKHGHEKESDADRLQLCAQVMALEEMLVCEIKMGALFYVETHRREIVPLTPELRAETQRMAAEMNQYFARGHTPKVKPGKHCSACSLKELCLPVLCRRADPMAYLRAHIEEEAEL